MAAGEQFRVDLDALACSAAHVNGQAEDLATEHLVSDNRMAAAQPGWVGASAAALQTLTATWLETSRRLLTRMGDHALDLHNDAIALGASERASIEALRAVRPADEGM